MDGCLCCVHLCRAICEGPSQPKKRIFSNAPLLRMAAKQSELLRDSHVGLESSKVVVTNWLDSFTQPPYETAAPNSTKPQLQESQVDEGIVLQALRPKEQPQQAQHTHTAPVQNPEAEPEELAFETLPSGLLNSVSQSKSLLYSQLPQDALAVSPSNLRFISRASLLRNKLAFFRPSLALVKDDPNFEIAFKRSDLDARLEEVRVILYVNNKTGRQVPVDVRYEYDEGKYEVMNPTRLKGLLPNTQGREELAVRLKDVHRTRPMSFITVHLKLGETPYDVVLPVLFLRFAEAAPSHRRRSFESKSLKVVPCRVFASPHAAYQVLPMNFVGEADEVEFLQGHRPYRTETGVETRHSKETLGLDWHEGLLRVTGSANWADMLGWVFADTRL